MNYCWTLLKWCAIAAILVVGIGVPYFHRRVDDTIRREVEARIAAHYAHLAVSVRAATLVEGEGIEIRGLSIMHPGATGAAAKLAYFEEVFLCCATDLARLVSGEIEVTRIVFRRPSLQLTRLAEDRWSHSLLVPWPTFGDCPPEVTIENGVIEVSDPLRQPPSSLIYRDLDLVLAAPLPAEGPHALEWRKFRGHFTGAHLERVEFEGQLDAKSGRCQLRGQLAGLQLSPELITGLPEPLRTRLDDLRAVRAAAELNFALDYHADRTPRLRYDVQGQVARGRVDDRRLPWPLTDVRARVQVNNDGLRLDDLVGRGGQTTFRLAAETRGHGPGAPMLVVGRCDHLLIDPQLVAWLPDEWQSYWSKLLPSGEIDIEHARLEFDGRQWHPELHVRCLDVGFSYHKFPYHLQRCRGTMRYVDKMLEVNLVAHSSGEEVRLAGVITRLGPEPEGWLEVKADQLPFDQRLLDALPTAQRDFVRAMRLQGTFNVFARLEHLPPGSPLAVLRREASSHDFRDNAATHVHAYAAPPGSSAPPVGPGTAGVRGVVQSSVTMGPVPAAAAATTTAAATTAGAAATSAVATGAGAGTRTGTEAGTGAGTGADGALHRHVVIHLNRCSVEYASFPYPLRDVRGTIELVDDTWQFRNLSGHNGTGQVHCNGSLVPTPQGSRLLLVLDGTDVPLEDELRDALNPAIQQFWYDLKPRGTVHLSSQVEYETPGRALRVTARILPIVETTSLEPRRFPLRLERLSGAIDYENGCITLERFSGRHAASTLTVDGTCQVEPDGRWNLDLRNFTADRVALDRGLLDAMPTPVAGRLRALALEGPISLRGSVQMHGTDDPNELPSAHWRIDYLDLQGGRAQLGLPVSDVHGGARNLVGGFDGGRFWSHGELAIDSLIYRGVQFTDLRGPLWIDPARVMVGRGAQQQLTGQANRPATATVLGGALVGDAWVTFETVPRFGLDFELRDADLSRAAQELFPGRGQLSGKVLAAAHLEGTGEGVRTLRGGGYVRLHDADIYQLPQMVALLKILSVRPPDTTAFSTSDIDFRVHGDHIYLDHINFRGDAITLNGRGEVGLDQSVNLTFYAMVGRDEINVPLVTPLFRGASQQILMLRAQGKLSDPDIRREHFPGVNQMLQQLGGERERQPPGAPLWPRGEPTLPPVGPRTAVAPSPGKSPYPATPPAEGSRY